MGGFRVAAVLGLILVAALPLPALAIGERIGGALPTSIPTAIPTSVPTLPPSLPTSIPTSTPTLPSGVTGTVESLLKQIPASPAEAPDGLFEGLSLDPCVPASVSQAVKSAGAKADKVKGVLDKARSGAPQIQSTVESLRSQASKLKDLVCLGSAKEFVGAVFNAPPSFSEPVAAYKVEVAKLLPGRIPENPFLLLTKQGLFLALADAKPVPSLGTVQGREIPVPMEFQGLRIGVILAESASFATDGQPATISQVKGDPDRYDTTLVRIDATLRQVAVIIDPDPAPAWTVTAGMVLDNPVQVAPLARELVTSADRITKAQGSVQKTFLGSEDHLLTFNFAEDWWGDIPAAVHGVALSGNKVKQALPAMPSRTGGAVLSDETPILYVVKVVPKPQEVSLSDLLSNPKAYDGKVVSFEAPALGFKVSLQETARLAGENYEADVVVHGLVAWSEAASGGGLVPGGAVARILPVVAADNEHFEQPAGGVQGRFRFIGKVITAGQIVEGLRGEPVLLQYRREKTGDLDLSQVAAEVRAQVEKEAQAVLGMVKGLGAVSGSASLSVGAAGGQASVSVSVEAPPGTTPTPQRVYIGEPGAQPKASPGFEVVLGLGALVAVGLARRRR